MKKEDEIRNVRIGFNTPYEINKKDIPFVKKFLKMVEEYNDI